MMATISSVVAIGRRMKGADIGGTNPCSSHSRESGNPGQQALEFATPDLRFGGGERGLGKRFCLIGHVLARFRAHALRAWHGWRCGLWRSAIDLDAAAVLQPVVALGDDLLAFGEPAIDHRAPAKDLADH